ncbi:MAG: nucleotide exchange factor GrpE [Desulfobulbaceae bacterium]|nr:nucleotide exchange factor GrpE [Desulfobulbaceae bacterium]
MPEDKNANNTGPEEAEVSNSETGNNANDLLDEAEQVEQDIESLRQEAENNRDKLLRLAAEFENYKKRMERERAATLKYAGENVLRELLSTVDNLERAIEQASVDTEDLEKKIQGMVEGVELTRKGLLATLEKFDVYPIESVGKKFDPNEQEAMAMEPSDNVPANHVLNEFVRGYRFKDRLLRAAKVIVSKGPGE